MARNIFSENWLRGFSDSQECPSVSQSVSGPKSDGLKLDVLPRAPFPDGSAKDTEKSEGKSGGCESVSVGARARR